MTYAIRIHQNGGPEQLNWEPVEVGKPGRGEVLVRNEAIGLNFIDVYYRTGLYSTPLPFVPGFEGAGVVEEVGAGVEGLEVGDRVGYIDPIGAYAQRVLRPADRLIRLPDGISSKVAAASMLKGLTAEYLVRRTYQVQAGDTLLVHAAAGGVGQILCQWATHLGATVIGTVGSDEKVALAKQAGCQHVINSSTEAISTRVRELTGGAGVPVVYDGVGKDTFVDSLDCLAPRGLMVSFGNASGAVEPFSPVLLAQKGSLYLTRPALGTYTQQRDDLLESAAALFDVLLSGAVAVPIYHTWPLADAAQAHAALEARRTTGSCLLIP